MSEAKLTIDIQDGGAGRGDSPRPDAVDADLLGRWKRLADAMGKAADDVAAKTARRGAPASAGGSAWGDLDFDGKRKAALGGRPEGVSDAEWAQFGRENARRGAAAGRMSGKVQDNARRLREDEERAREAQAERDRKLTEQQEQRAEAQREKDASAERKKQHERSVLGGAVGGRLGGRAGAAIGTAIAPGVGTAIGAVVGTVAGSYLGGKVAGKRDAGEDDKAGLSAGPMGQVQAVMDGTEKALRFAGRAFDEAGRAAVKVAGNDGFGVLKQGAELAADGLEGIPVVGKAAGEGLRMLGRAVGAAEQAMNAFAARGKELAQYSGTLSAAAARQDVTRMLGDIRESRRLEKEYAAMIQIQTEMSETIRAGLEPLKRMAMTWLPEILGKMLTAIITGLEVLDELAPGPTVWGEMAAEMRKTREEIQRGAGEDQDIDKWLMPVPLPRFDPVGAPADPRGLGIPLIPGS